MLISAFRRIKFGLTSLPAMFYQYGSLGFLYWTAMAATSFTTVYLQRQGFNAAQIGSMNAAFTVINVLSPPLWGIVSDKIRSVKKVFAICVLFSTVFWLLLPQSIKWFSPMAVLIVIPFFRLFNSPTPALLDSWIVRSVNRDGRIGFGPIRLWGSVGWAIIAFIYGIVLRTAQLDIIFVGFALFSIPCVILTLCIKEEDDGSRHTLSLRDMQIGLLFRTKPIAAFLLFNLLLYTPIMASFTFMPFLVEAVGGHSSLIGIIASLEAILEIPLLFFSARLLKRYKITNMIIFCALLYTAELTLYSICGSPWQIPMIKAIHGLGYGLYLSCNVQYIFRHAPKNLTATAQTLVSCSNAAAGILGNLIGGAVVQTMGIRVFFQFSCIFMAVVVAAYYIWLRLNKESEAVATAA